MYNYTFILCPRCSRQEGILSAKNRERFIFRFTKEKKKLDEIQQAQREALLQYDYNAHLYKELLEAKLVEDEQELLEEKLDKINNVEEIQQNLSEALQLTTDENIGIQNLIYSLEQKLAKIASYAGEYQEFLEFRSTYLRKKFMF